MTVFSATGRNVLMGAASLLTLAALMPAAAIAQDGGAAEIAATTAEAGVGDIVVTAQFRAQSLQNTPLSITAVDAALLDARGQTNIADVAAQAPNVVLVPGGAAFGPSLGAQIRGVGQFDFNPAYEPGVGVYVDEVYMPTLTGSVFALLDLERVEVLRGPQGTLTGRNSIGGAIKLFSRKPEGSNTGFGEATYGSRNRIGLRGGFDLRLTDALSARVSAVYRQQEGFVSLVDYGCANPGNAEGIPSYAQGGNCERDDKLGEDNYVGVRGSLRFNPSDSFDFIVTADYTRISQMNPAEVLTRSGNPNFFCGKFCTYADYRTPPGSGQLGAPGVPAQATLSDPKRSFEGWGVSGQGEIQLSDSLQLVSITAYRKYTTSFGTDDDFTPSPLIAALGNNKLDHTFFSQELRLNGELGDKIDFTIGGYYSDQKTTYFTQQDIRYIAGNAAALQFIGDDPVNASTKAVFGTVFFRPTDALTVTAGIRYTEEAKDYTFVRKTFAGARHPFLGALDGFTAEYEGNRVDYRLSADYRFSDAVLAYATFSTGFKGGGVSARPFNVTQALDGNFDPETLTAYEIGFKTDLLDRTLRMNLSAFYNKYKDVILPLQDCARFGGGPCGVTANAGDSDIKGIELEIQAMPTPALSFDASISYLTATWKRLNPAVSTVYQDWFNTPATSAPKFKASMGIQYKAELGTSGSITPRFDLAWQDQRYSGRLVTVAGSTNPRDYPALWLPSFVMANARLTWRNANEDIDLSLEVTNIFDTYYSNAIFAAVYANTRTSYEAIGRPREWAVTLRKTF